MIPHRVALVVLFCLLGTLTAFAQTLPIGTRAVVNPESTLFIECDNSYFSRTHGANCPELKETIARRWIGSSPGGLWVISLMAGNRGTIASGFVAFPKNNIPPRTVTMFIPYEGDLANQAQILIELRMDSIRKFLVVDEPQMPKGSQQTSDGAGQPTRPLVLIPLPRPPWLQPIPRPPMLQPIPQPKVLRPIGPEPLPTPGSIGKRPLTSEETNRLYPLVE